MMYKKSLVFVGLFGLILLLVRCQKASFFPDTGYDEQLAGGMATTFVSDGSAYGQSIPNLSSRDQRFHEIGDAAFENQFVSTPAPVRPGLGVIYNNVSCQSCHKGDAKGLPTFGNPTSAMLMRISIGNDEISGPIAAPGYGAQLQDKAVFGVEPEVNNHISYTTLIENYDDGSTVSLRNPTYTFTKTYIPMPNSAQFSPRLAPSVFGLGLLEAVSEQTILSFADERDVDGDGISGKPNYVLDGIENQPSVRKIGRFGHKANTATILSQVAGAYNQDMGLTNYVMPTENSKGQTQEDKLNDDPELADTILKANAFYIQTLAVPARRDVKEPNVVAGKALFINLKCAKCHIPSMQTGLHRLAALSNQRIQPFTDLLLHDMGEGLADNRADYRANGREWRTAPLWGIGLLPRVNGTPFYLHDGRARTLEEAILWHGGEALNSKNSFKKLTKTEREKVIIFLESL